MILSHLKVNHLAEPFGFDISKPNFGFLVQESSGDRLAWARIRISDRADFSEILYDSGRRTDLSPLGFVPDFRCKGGKRYFWEVSAAADDGDCGFARSWFEGGRAEESWELPWLGSPLGKDVPPVFFRQFWLENVTEIESARLYVCGLGIYEAYFNGEKVGEEYFAPFSNDYRYWVQYQTYDAGKFLREGENAIAVLLGNGWFKGRFPANNDGSTGAFGNRFLLSAELVLKRKNGCEERISTDGKWKCADSPVRFAEFYDGEIYDARREVWTEAGALAPRLVSESVSAVGAEPPAGKVLPRLSPPVCAREEFEPTLLVTPKGEIVLDFGQEITGWVEFDCALRAGHEVKLQFGEILQEECFYRDNLRSAKAEFVYLGDGKAAHVRPHFTFFGFRFVKVEGLLLTEENLSDYRFRARVIHSELERTGFLETSDAKLNRFLENTRWGQKGNFLDVPTDCPQRDERLGWTGDAQVFCGTACYHMDTAAFYRKYLFDMRTEQRANCGSVPFVVPDVLGSFREILGQPKPDFDTESWGETGSSAWGDAATIIPWTVYRFTGDVTLLAESYENMKLWTDFIIRMDETFCGGKRLWDCGFHFGDWLALDNPDTTTCFGRTDHYFVASVYYLYSAELTAKAARLLGKKEDAEYYGKIAREVRRAVRRGYVTPGGRLASDTQTALVLALYFDLLPKGCRKKAARELHKKLEARGMRLDTGFVGTAYLCKALTKAGLTEDAYSLLLQEEYPSWLYEVNMGATTVWERWNSVLPDGKISGIFMNSLNHYAYGAVAEWVYGTVCGILPADSAHGAGFCRVVFSPVPDRRLGFARGEYHSAAGVYRSGWKMNGELVEFEVEVPFGCGAEFCIPANCEGISVDGEPIGEGKIQIKKGRHVIVGKLKEI